jgi:hypothetical protein
MLPSLAKYANMVQEAEASEPDQLTLRLHRIRIEGKHMSKNNAKYGASATLTKAPFLPRPLNKHNFLYAGFKVYSSPTEVGPLRPFNCIIGPNGIGKSVLVSNCLFLHISIIFKL